MPISADIPVELKRAAEILQARLDLLHARSRSVQTEEWAMLDSEIRAYIPDWLTSLHASFRLCDAVLMTMDPSEEFRLVFRFCDPQTLKSIFGSEEYIRLLAAGLFPVGEELNDDLWLINCKNGPEGELFLFRSTDWDGSLEGIKDAISFASEKLSHAMLAMEIGNDGRFPGNGGMWSRIEQQDE